MPSPPMTGPKLALFGVGCCVGGIGLAVLVAYAATKKELDAVGFG